MKYWRIPLLLLAASLSVFGPAPEAGPAASAQPAQRLGSLPQIIQAASCSQTDVQAAIDAAGEGDFVRVPAGYCAWSTPASSQPSLTINQKGLTLVGAGIGLTVISDTTTTGWNETPLVITGAAGKPFRVTGFTFIGNGQNDSFPVIQVSGDNRNWRLDHLQFNDTKRAINTTGETYGVIDHCNFIVRNYDFPHQAIAIGTGDATWHQPLTLGTAQAVYIEDNLFDYTHFGNTADGHIGAKYVFRHNTLIGTYVEAHGYSSGLSSGTFSYEIYANTLTGIPDNWAPVSLRGGTGVVYNNTITGTFGLPHVMVYNDRSCPGENWQGTCDGTSVVDGNQNATGYPCRDQIGRSTYLSNGQQSLEPLYEWNNTYNSADVDIRLSPGMCAYMANHIQANRDYYEDTVRPGYTPYVYPHPLTQELVLSGTPGNQTLSLAWQVRTILPLTTTWTIAYTGPGGVEPPVTGLANATRAYTLSGLTNYAWYTVTLTAVGTAPLLTDTVRLMPTDRFTYLPAVRK